VALWLLPGCWVTGPEVDEKVGPLGQRPGGPSCTALEQIQDGGFEGGTPNEAWSEGSVQFETPICDSTCDPSGNASPFRGAYWAWFGGTKGYEEASISQSVELGDQGSATLSFWLRVPNATAGSSDRLTIMLDGAIAFELPAVDAEGMDTYTELSVDLDAWADDDAHLLEVRGVFSGDGNSSFLVDDLSLLACPPSPEA